MLLTLPARGEYSAEKVIREEVAVALFFFTNRDSLSVCGEETFAVG